MNIFHKVALQGLLKNRMRTLVTIVGVILSTAMFTAVATFGASLLNYLVNVEIGKGGNWHVTFSDVSSGQIRELAEDQEVSDMAVYDNIGYALLEGAGEQSAEKPYLFLAGFDDETFEKLPISLISGRMPENNGEVLVPADSIAVKAGVRISLGDTLNLLVGQRECNGKQLTQCDFYRPGEGLVNAKERTYTVVGTFERPGFEIHSSPGYTVVTRADDGEQTDSYSLYIALENPRQVKAYADSHRQESAYAVNENLLRFMGISDNKIFNAFLYTIGGVLVAIIMVGSVFMIYNSFNISLNERVHQFGIFMSVGATARQLRSSVLFEGICIGSIGIPFGILAGIGSIRMILPVVARNFSGMVYSNEQIALSVSFPDLAASVIISQITILISAFIPAKKAAATPVMECIRQTNEIKMQTKSVRTSKTAWKLYGLEGTLALKNFKRNKKRYRSIVLSLTLSVVLAVAGSAFGTTLKTIARQYTGQTADGDIIFTTQDMEQSEFFRLYDQFKNMDGIDRCTWQADKLYACKTDELPDDFLVQYRAAMKDRGTGQTQQMTMYTQFIEDDIYCEFVESLGLPVEEYTGQNGKVLACCFTWEDHMTYFAGDSMNFTLISPLSGQTKTVCASFADSYPLDTAFVFESEEKTPDYMFVMSVPMSMKAQFDGLETVDDSVCLGAFFWTETPVQALAQIQAILTGEKVSANYILLNLSQAFDLYRNVTFVVDIFTYVFVFMISLIAVANVFNTISTNIRLRRRELAMLRSVGMSDRGFQRMMNYECVFYGMRTLLFAIPISALCSWVIYEILISAEKMDDVAFDFPWEAMGISVLGVFCIVFITMLYATGKIRKENIIDALRDEMT